MVAKIPLKKRRLAFYLLTAALLAGAAVMAIFGGLSASYTMPTTAVVNPSAIRVPAQKDVPAPRRVAAARKKSITKQMPTAASVKHQSTGSDNQSELPAPTIAWAVTVSKDGPIADGAVVLMESIIQSMDGHSKFRHAFVAFVVPEAPRAAKMLQKLGWRVLVKPMPLTVESIRGKVLRERIMKAGCCGGNELLKLYAYTLPEYHRVVHLDIDMLVLQQMDELFVTDAAMARSLKAETVSPTVQAPGQWADGERVGAVPMGSIGIQSLVYTSDYNMMPDGKRKNKVPGAVQGGFLVIKPDQAVFDMIVEIVREGSHNAPRTGGWRNSGIGTWWGGATIQGVLPYFYAPIEKKGAPERDAKTMSAHEVDRCVYDNMVDKAVIKPAPYVGAAACQQTPIEQVKAMHFTLCQKPWICRPLQHEDDKQGLCVAFHERWHQFRRDAERRHSLGSKRPELPPWHKKKEGNRPAFTWKVTYCKHAGVAGYVPVDDKEIMSRKDKTLTIIDPKLGLIQAERTT